MDRATTSSGKQRKAECVFATSSGLLKPVDELTLPPVKKKYPVRSQAELNSTFNRLHYTHIHEKGDQAPKSALGQAAATRETSQRSRRPRYEEPKPPRRQISPERADALVGRLAQIPKRLIYAASSTAHPTSSSTVVLGPIDDQKPPDYDAKKDSHLALYWARQEVLRQKHLESSKKLSARKQKSEPPNDTYERAPMPATDSGHADRRVEDEQVSEDQTGHEVISSNATDAEAKQDLKSTNEEYSDESFASTPVGSPQKQESMA